MDGSKIPEIRDMTSQCKNCGDYHFASEINKDGLCHDCANGKTKTKPAKDELDDFDLW